jgi:hypothetical protein
MSVARFLATLAICFVSGTFPASAKDKDKASAPSKQESSEPAKAQPAVGYCWEARCTPKKKKCVVPASPDCRSPAHEVDYSVWYYECYSTHCDSHGKCS